MLTRGNERSKGSGKDIVKEGEKGRHCSGRKEKEERFIRKKIIEDENAGMGKEGRRNWKKRKFGGSGRMEVRKRDGRERGDNEKINTDR